MNRSNTLLGIVSAFLIVTADAHGSQDAPDRGNGQIEALRRDVEALRSDLADRDQLIDGLTDEVRNLHARLDDNWLTEERADQVRGLVLEVLADADSRTSLLQDSMTAGWDGHFFMASADGNFSLKIAGQLQTRFVYNKQDEGPIDDNRSGFENRRTKLRFRGHVVDPSWEYSVTTSFNREADGVARVLTAAIRKDFGNGWRLRAGQFKPPFLREELMSSRRQLAAERSLANEEFAQGYAQGIEVEYEGESFRASVMYHDGFGTRSTPALASDTEGAVTTRAEVLLAGRWKQFRDFTSWSDDEFGLMIGAAFHYEEDEYGTFLFETETISYTIDASIEFGGAHLYGAFVSRNLDSASPFVAEKDQHAFIVQGGIFIVPDTWEIFARYETGDLDTIGQEDLNVLTVGINRYFARHDVKWTTDVGIGLDPLTANWVNDGTGWRADSFDQDGQIVVRTQLQLLF